MKIDTLKLELVQLILECEDYNTIMALYKLFYKQKNILYSELTSQEIDEINQGLEELNQSKMISFKKFSKILLNYEFTIYSLTPTIIHNSQFIINQTSSQYTLYKIKTAKATTTIIINYQLSIINYQLSIKPHNNS